jgi:hypothetical protein
MNSQQRARRILQNNQVLFLWGDLAAQLENEIAAAIDEAVTEAVNVAVTEERAACALVADFARLPAWQQPVPMQEGCRWARREIGDAIRARSKGR